jgi:hypothetical protein
MQCMYNLQWTQNTGHITKKVYLSYDNCNKVKYKSKQAFFNILNSFQLSIYHHLKRVPDHVCLCPFLSLSVNYLSGRGKSNPVAQAKEFGTQQTVFHLSSVASALINICHMFIIAITDKGV